MAKGQLKKERKGGACQGFVRGKREGARWIKKKREETEFKETREGINGVSESLRNTRT